MCSNKHKIMSYYKKYICISMETEKKETKRIKTRKKIEKNKHYIYIK